MQTTISVAELTVGMYVAKGHADAADSRSVYCVEGLITYPHEVTAIREKGFEQVLIDPAKGVDPAEPVQDRLGPLLEGDVSRPKDVLPLAGEIKAARSVHRDAQNQVRDMVIRCRQNAPVDFKASLNLMARMADSVQRNADALWGVSTLRAAEDRSVNRSLNTAIMSVVFGHYLGLKQSSLPYLGQAGLVANLEADVKSAAKEDADASAQSGGEQVAGDGGRILAKLHHRQLRYGNTGCFEHFSGPELEWVGHIVAMVEAYESLTGRRNGRSAHLPCKAVGKLYAMGDEHFARPVLEHFIRCVGVYPFGSFVKLSCGNHGFVCVSPRLSAAAPVVRIALDAKLRPLPPKDVNLSTEKGMKIVECLDPYKCGLDPARFLIG